MIIFWLTNQTIRDLYDPTERKSTTEKIRLTTLLICMFTVCGLMIPTLPCECLCPKRAMPARAKLRRLWLATRFIFIVMGTLMLIGETAFTRFPKVQFIAWSISFVVCGVLTTRANRGRITRFLGSIGGSGDDETQRGAAIAALVGSLSAEQAISHAQDHFRKLPFSALSASDLASNTDTGLFDKTSKAALGTCDCFFSHSWHDGGADKYSALQEWADSEGGDPTIWLDKACIDQTDIDANLAALPLFLSGCKSLVVAAGATYPSRLWCIMEVRDAPAAQRSTAPPSTHALGHD